MKTNSEESGDSEKYLRDNLFNFLHYIDVTGTPGGSCTCMLSVEWIYLCRSIFSGSPSDSGVVTMLPSSWALSFWVFYQALSIWDVRSTLLTYDNVDVLKCGVVGKSCVVAFDLRFYMLTLALYWQYHLNLVSLFTCCKLVVKDAVKLWGRISCLCI